VPTIASTLDRHSIPSLPSSLWPSATHSNCLVRERVEGAVQCDDSEVDHSDEAVQSLEALVAFAALAPYLGAY
jgi:hypothetical protein